MECLGQDCCQCYSALFSSLIHSFNTGLALPSQTVLLRREGSLSDQAIQTLLEQSTFCSGVSNVSSPTRSSSSVPCLCRPWVSSRTGPVWNGCSSIWRVPKHWGWGCGWQSFVLLVESRELRLVDSFLVHQWLRKLQKAQPRAFHWKQAWFDLCALSWGSVTGHHYFSWASLTLLSPGNSRSLGAPKGWVQIIHLESTFYTTGTHNFIWILLAFLRVLEDTTTAK